jgi:type I restriction enzyme S subunit
MKRDVWQSAPLGRLLRRNEQTIPIDPTEEYREVTVRLWGKGVILRGIVSGSSISADRRVQVSTNQFIISKIDARNGAMGLVPPELDGAVVSNDFPTFEPDQSRLLPEYLGWLSRTKPFVEACSRASEGTTNRVRLKEDRFDAIEILLPPIDEQRRIVSRIEFFTNKIDDANGLKKRVLPELLSLRHATFREAFVRLPSPNANANDAINVLNACSHEKAALIAAGDIRRSVPSPTIRESEHPFSIPAHWQFARFDDICRSISDGTHQTPTYTDSGKIFLSAQNVKPYRFLPEVHRYVSTEDFDLYNKNVKPENGDILMTRVGAGIGETAAIDRDLEFAIYVSLCLIKPLRSFPSIPYLVHWLNSPFGVRAAAEKTLGRGSSQGNLNLKLIREFVIPVPPASEQWEIVEFLDHSRSRFDQLKQIGDKAAIEVNALLPSILDRAFAGEL